MAEPLTEVAKAIAPQEGLHLYHNSMSSCSQLVRIVLAYKELEYTSHHLNLRGYEQYTPGYVRLNPRGVVPTLVYNGKVTTDSFNIVKHLDKCFPKTKQILPVDQETRMKVLKEGELVDGIPLYPITFGNCHYPQSDQRPILIRKGAGKKPTAGAIEKLKVLLENHTEDEELRSFYERRLKKAQQDTIRLEPAEVKKIVDETALKLDKLEVRLEASETFENGGFLFTETPCLADFMWSYVINRFAFLNLNKRLWDDGKHPNLCKYIERLFALEAFKKGVREWEGLLVMGTLILKSKLFPFSV